MSRPSIELNQRVKITKPSDGHVHGKFGKVIEIDEELLNTWYLVELEFQGTNDTPNEWCTRNQVLAAASSRAPTSQYPAVEKTMTVSVSEWWSLKHRNEELEAKLALIEQITQS